MLTDDLRNALQSFLHVEWLSVAFTVIIVMVVTALISHLLTKLLRRLLSADKNPLPSSSIFINIGRVAVWTVGICVILSSCFGVNVSAAITALGIGGIAISLGFQSTLSNLIGGLQISIMHLVVPGDHIMVGSNEGIVDDVTWRHTSMVTTRGETVIIPNSVINTEALVKLPPETAIRVNIAVSPDEGDLDDIAQKMEQAVRDEVGKIAVIEDGPKVSFLEMTDFGYRGTIAFGIGEGVNASTAKDAALKAVSPYAQKAKAPKTPHRQTRRRIVRRKRADRRERVEMPVAAEPAAKAKDADE